MQAVQLASSLGVGELASLPAGFPAVGHISSSFLQANQTEAFPGWNSESWLSQED